MTDHMTQEQAEAEMEVVKAIIDRHVDQGWLAGYGPELKTGKFEYTCWYNHYEAKCEMESEVAT